MRYWRQMQETLTLEKRDDKKIDYYHSLFKDG